MAKYRKYTQEYRDEAVKLVLETSRPIADVARELGIHKGTLGHWTGSRSTGTSIRSARN